MNWGHWDSDVDKFINYKDILKIKEKTETKMNEITEILEKIYHNEELRQTIVPLFISDPGQGN